MSIGLSIFVGLMFCGFVYLYTKNRDRWSWRKFWKIIGVVIAIPILIALLVIGGVYLNDKYENRARLVTEFRGIKIGDSYSDFMFRTPNVSKDQNSTSQNKDQFVLPDDGIYDFENKRGFVSIINNHVVRIGYNCDQYDSSSINGIECGDNGDSVLEKFGSEVEIRCPVKDEKIVDPDRLLIRVYQVKKYGVRYHLYLNKVNGLMVYDASIPVKWKTLGDCPQ